MVVTPSGETAERAAGYGGLVFREETATFRSLARPETQIGGVLR